MLRTCRPKEFGGFEYDGEVALKIALTISAACASTGWTVNGAVSNGFSFGHWPIEAQRELWGGDADLFTFACFAPTGTAVPADGGYVLTGRWSFASGCDISAWGKLGAMIQRQGASARRCLLPVAGRRLPRSSTTGSSAAWPAPAARTSSSRICSCRRTGYCCSPTPGLGTAPGARHHDNPLYRIRC